MPVTKSKIPMIKEIAFAEITKFANYRTLLSRIVDSLRESGVSVRKFSSLCGITSPNYLQQVISGDRNLTPAALEKISGALRLDKNSKKYFALLLRLEKQTSGETQVQLLEERKKLVAISQKTSVVDADIYSSWLHGVIFCLAAIEGIDLEPKIIARKLQAQVSVEDIQSSIKLLVSRGYLLPTGEPQRYKQQTVRFKPVDDIRRIDVQKSHLRYLDMAKFRINDSVDEREFQGLTIAIPWDEFSFVKGKLRSLMDEINDHFAASKVANTLIRIQCVAFKVTHSKG